MRTEKLLLPAPRVLVYALFGLSVLATVLATVRGERTRKGVTKVQHEISVRTCETAAGCRAELGALLRQARREGQPAVALAGPLPRGTRRVTARAQTGPAASERTPGEPVPTTLPSVQRGPRGPAGAMGRPGRPGPAASPPPAQQPSTPAPQPQPTPQPLVPPNPVTQPLGHICLGNLCIT